MPARLLPLLTDRPQSGESLGLRLGVNRVTVNTLARRLAEEGVPVVTSRGGYALAPGTPAPGLVPVAGTFGQALRYAGTVGSTQDEARAWADDPHDPAPHGAVVVAERQTAGRGRRGRVWDTTGGTLVFSVLLGGPLALPELALMPLAAGVALRAACGVGGLKWPNDLLAPPPDGTGGRKLAGILLEADLRGEEARRAVLGIGVNVSAAPEGAAWLSAFTPGLTRAALLARILAELERWLAAPPGAVLDAWRAVNVTLGREVRVSTPRGDLTGTALDLDAQGSLLIRTPEGSVVTAHAGDVHLIGSLAPSAPAPQDRPQEDTP
ncbi:bifunctional biotin operon repressor/biotin--acetyl-CoA-carboxylase ligase BirA [Deinococcus phoenicis]|uniref:biotin--[biotin carboxyl-carrier protein] ligase n=1 Tax=Deinococcus phoenicis TaxID=1476583 RepID=A0A016QLX0_9DEIO|nr:bifunctional biotin--[acetyl-CoA-carboxylase] synthetase/biotin operon repressor [Deinococcus phoenicis]EYB67130.1 bifunctional biotin operon repressor/biotin--acetyl-CoA-carboxylase ligase BirA [Deinococcus phoenicis]